MALITISRQLGSLGSEIANKLKSELNYRFLDKESLEKTLSEYGIDEEYVEKCDEKKPGFWESIALDKDRYLHFVKKAILEFSLNGSGIILGRGGQLILKGLPATLHIRFVAPLDHRVSRVSSIYNCDTSHAVKIIRQSDSDRAGFHKYFFYSDWDAVEHYDIVFNTMAYSEKTMIKTIRTIIESDEFLMHEAAAKKNLKDLCLGQEVLTRILYREKISVQFIEAIADDGTITLRGTTIAGGDIKKCDDIAAETPGVKTVKNEISFIPISYGMT